VLSANQIKYPWILYQLILTILVDSGVGEIYIHMSDQPWPFLTLQEKKKK
jgi:hypothetical protein